MKTRETQDQKISPIQGDDLFISLRESEKEKDILLALSDELAHLRDKQELLRVVQFHLKEIGFTTDIMVTILNEDRTSFSRFCKYPLNKNFSLPGNQAMAQTDYPYPDGFFEFVVDADVPLLFYPEDLVGKEGMPRYIKTLYKQNIHEIIGIALMDSRQVIDGLFLFSETKNKYTRKQFKLVQGIASQVATAVTKILATEASQKDELEKKLLLTISNDITKIQNQEDFQSLVNGRIKELLPFQHGILGIFNKKNGKYTTLLIDPPPKIANRPVLDIYSEVGYPDKNMIVDRVLNADRPILIDLDAYAAVEELPIYTRMN